MAEPTFEAENRTECPNTGEGHVWIWDDEKEEYFCDECGVTEDKQEE